MRYLANATPSAVPLMVINLSFAWEDLSSSFNVIMAPVICLEIQKIRVKIWWNKKKGTLGRKINFEHEGGKYKSKFKNRTL